MLDKIIENHKIITMEHNLRNEGHYLSEKKQMILIEGVDPESLENGSKMVTLVHLRSIDDKCYKVTENFPDGYDKKLHQNVGLRHVETEMSEEEIEKFEVDWELLWQPEITKTEIASLHQRLRMQ